MRRKDEIGKMTEFERRLVALLSQLTDAKTTEAKLEVIKGMAALSLQFQLPKQSRASKILSKVMTAESFGKTGQLKVDANLK